MSSAAALARGRDAFAHRAWGDAYRALAEADVAAERGADAAGGSPEHATERLDPDDLERLAIAAYLAGHDREHAVALERAHRRFVANDAAAAALRSAFWLGMTSAQRGETGRAGGWFARARRLAEEHHERPERAYAVLPEALRQLPQDPLEARVLFTTAAELAADSDDRDLQVLAQLGLAQALIAAGAVDRGMPLLDEVMTAVQGDEVSPVAAGVMYCAAIDACRACFDLRRAQEWTAALTAWCASQPDLVPFRGQCLVHRAELLQLHGDWDEALAEAERASQRFVRSGQSAIGEAHYRTAELHRVRGDHEAAEDHYRQASQYGHPAEPGLALLRLAAGEVDVAAATLRRALDEEHARPATRANLLAATVEVALASGDLEAARRSADELAGLARALGSPMLAAAAAHVTGAVALAEGDTRSALPTLRRAAAGWRDLDVPYEAARVRVRIGLACRALGDEEGAALEFDAASATFRSLGARPELDRLARLHPPERIAPAPARSSRPDRPGGLTEREVEVLRLVASGRSNRAVAEELGISEHTVARHVQNIFAKLGVGSRTAAAAFAYQHDLR
jgi:ATP/maltotriose-dependent transcriptional regulator MalT